MWSWPYFPLPGNNGKFTTPQTPSAPAPLTQGSLSLPPRAFLYALKCRYRYAKTVFFPDTKNCRIFLQKGVDKKGLFPYNKQVTPSGFTPCGGIAQLARAFGSYPKCHRFKSSYRYHRYKVSLKYLGTGCNSGRWVACCFSEILYSMRPVGQAVKTRPFHGCNMGSIPVRVTKQNKSEPYAGRRRVRICCLLSLKDGLARCAD